MKSLSVFRGNFIWCVCALLFVLMASCRPPPTARPQDPPLIDSRPAQPVPVLSPVADDTLPRTSGPVIADGMVGVVVPRDAVDVVVEVAGRLAIVAPEIGDLLEVGATVAVIEARELDEQLAMARARLAAGEAERREAAVAVDQAQRRLERRRAAAEIFSREAIEAVADQLEVAEAVGERVDALVDRDRAEVERIAAQLARATVRAPIRGRLSQQRVAPGSIVRPGDVIARLVAPDSAYIRFAVSPRAIDTFAIGTPVRFVDDSGAAVSATVARIAPEVDSASAMIFVDADLVQDARAGTIPRAGVVGSVFLQPRHRAGGAQAVAPEHGS